MLELDHLTVSGDVTFGRNVTLKVHIEKHMGWFIQETIFFLMINHFPLLYRYINFKSAQVMKFFMFIFVKKRRIKRNYDFVFCEV